MFNKSSKDKSTLPDKNAISSKDWLPVKAAVNGIILLKNGDYLKILEVLPINFKLRSKVEKRAIILNYREFLKACHYPIQVSIQCKKADIEPHIKRMEGYLKEESNDNVKSMGKGYIGLA
jgi:conjugal transfer ATP-binding protein TraC